MLRRSSPSPAVASPFTLLTALLAALLATLLAACGGATTPPDDSGSSTGDPPSTSPNPSPTGSPSPSGGACRDGETKPTTGSSDGCFSATNHVCGDYSRAYECVGGAFVCPRGTVPAKDCWCYGMAPPPGACTCSPSGWSCSQADAGLSP